MTIQTPREATGTRPGWDDELQWLDLLVADSGRVRLHQVATSYGGREILMVGVGGTSPPPEPAQAPAGGLLYVCYQHGHEPAPRESAFQVLRDLSYTTDADLRAYLDERPVWVMPSTNADRAPYHSFTTGGRETLEGVDMNRSHINLQAQESVAIQQAITLARPDVIIDCHEGATEPDNVEVGGPLNANVTTQARSWGDGLVQAILTDLNKQGYVASLWPSTAGWPSMLRNSAGLRHAASCIIEGRTKDTGMQDRIDQVTAAMVAGLQFHRTYAADLEADLEAGRAAARAAGATGAPVRFTGPGYDTTLDPAPIAYRVTEDMRAAIATHLDTFGITAERDDSGTWVVPMDQDAQPIIPFIIDNLSPDKTISAHRVYPRPDRDLIPGSVAGRWGPVHIHGMDREVLTAHVMLNGELVPLAND